MAGRPRRVPKSKAPPALPMCTSSSPACPRVTIRSSASVARRCLAATANALDAETERLIFQALASLKKSRTTFLIAHRLSTVRHADRIVVLNDGQVAECGTHEQLLARGELYAHLHDRSSDRKQPSAQTT